MSRSIPELAAGLTKAQRRFFARTNDGLMFERYADLRTLNALDDQGLTDRYMRTSDFEVLVTLTPLGLAVRQHLVESNRHGE